MQLPKGGRPAANGRSHETTGLANLGITKNQSSRWQRLASVPEEAFLAYRRRCGDEGKEMTAAGLLRFARLARSLATSASRSSSAETEPDLRRRECGSPVDGSGGGGGQNVSALLEELKGHRALLESILEPLIQDGSADLRQCERRALSYLLTELKTVMAELEHSTCGSE